MVYRGAPPPPPGLAWCFNSSPMLAPVMVLSVQLNLRLRVIPFKRAGRRRVRYVYLMNYPEVEEVFAPRRLGTAVCVISLRAPSFNLNQGLGKLVVDISRQSDLYYLLGGDRRVHHYWCTGAHHHHHHPVMRGASILLQSWPQSWSCRCNCICGSPCSPSREPGVGVSGMFT